MAILAKQNRFLSIFLLLLACCFLLIVFLSGFQHETKKFKALLVTIFAVLLFAFFLGDIVYFILRALYGSYRERTHISKSAPDALQAATVSEAQVNFNRGAYLSLRLAGLRSSLLLSEQQRDEALNLRYKEIERELWLFLRYFWLLLLLVVCTRDPLAYYNTHIVRTSLEQPMNDVNGIRDIYDFIEHTLVESLSPDKNNDSQQQRGSIHFEVTKLLDVVRLRQLRYANNETMAQEQPGFTHERYLPQWQLPFVEYHYVRKYWRTYGPWLPYKDDSFGSVLLLSSHQGDLHTYADDEGYVALLARDSNNSKQILQYLRQYDWLDERTAALFVEFTLFNVDSNLFSVCTLLWEQTPFGGLLPHAQVHSCELLLNLEHLSFAALFVLMLYILQMIQFTQVYVLRVWHAPHELLASWNVLDALIVSLNVIVLLLLYQREAAIQRLLRAVGSDSKLEFLDFRIPAQLDYLALVFAGLLVCCATLRIWRILQFSSLFRTFTRTLHIAKWALVSTTLIIVIVLFSLGLSSCLINGANSVFFIRVLKSVTAVMSFSLGIGHQMQPQDLSYGGYILGMLLFAVIILGVAVVLLNMFITLIIDYFTLAKRLERSTQLSFLQFLALEYAWICRLLHSNRCKRKQGAVSEQVQRQLDRLQAAQARQAQRKSAEQMQDEQDGQQDEEQHDLAAAEAELLQRQKERMDFLKLLASILATQVELLDRKVVMLDIENDSDEDASQFGHEPSADTSGSSKNGKRSSEDRRSGIKMKLLTCLQMYSRFFA